jgi:hypothetical protein
VRQPIVHAVESRLTLKRREAMEPLPANTDRFIQTIEIEAASLNEARRQIQSEIPTGFRVEETILADGMPQTVRTTAATVDDAFAQAQSALASNAKISEKKIITYPERQTLKVEASEEESVRRDFARHDAEVKSLRLISACSKGFLGIGKKPNVYSAEVFQNAVVEITYLTPAKISASIQGRRNDGTILGNLIANDTYSGRAGSEKIGYFDPKLAPFRAFPNGKTGLLGGPEADQQMRRNATIDSFSAIFSKRNDDKTVEMVDDACGKLSLLAYRINDSPSSELLDGFGKLTRNEAISEFLLVTTTMPFFLTYSTRQVAVIAEVDYELKLNALFNLLLNDKSISFGSSTVRGFGEKVASFLESRKAEVEEKKHWAIDFQKKRDYAQAAGQHL